MRLTAVHLLTCHVRSDIASEVLVLRLSCEPLIPGDYSCGGQGLPFLQ